MWTINVEQRAVVREATERLICHRVSHTPSVQGKSPIRFLGVVCNVVSQPSTFHDPDSISLALHNADFFVIGNPDTASYVVKVWYPEMNSNLVRLGLVFREVK